MGRRAYTGDRHAHLQWLARPFDEREGIVPLLKNDPAMDPMRFDPAFRAMFDRLGLP